MRELTTEVHGLNFFLQGNRLCIVTHDPYANQTKSKGKRHWLDLNPNAAKQIGKLVGDHIEAEEEDARLTPAQLAEKYQEMMGS